MSGELPEYVADYRRLWWGHARERWFRTATYVATGSAGLIGGLWLTRTWSSDAWITVNAVGLCAAGAIVAGTLGITLFRRIVPNLRLLPTRPQLIRLTVRGETAVVVAPFHGGSSAAEWAGVGVGVALLQVLGMLDIVGLAAASALTMLGAIATTAVYQTLSWLGRPRLALFADRVEVTRTSWSIRYSLARHILRW